MNERQKYYCLLRKENLLAYFKLEHRFIRAVVMSKVNGSTEQKQKTGQNQSQRRLSITTYFKMIVANPCPVIADLLFRKLSSFYNKYYIFNTYYYMYRLLNIYIYLLSTSASDLISSLTKRRRAIKCEKRRKTINIKQC